MDMEQNRDTGIVDAAGLPNSGMFSTSYDAGAEAESNMMLLNNMPADAQYDQEEREASMLQIEVNDNDDVSANAAPPLASDV